MTRRMFLLLAVLLASSASARAEDYYYLQGSQSGRASGNSNGVELPVSDFASCSIQIIGTFSAVFNPEVSIAGKWEPIIARNLKTDETSLTITGEGFYAVSWLGATKFRCRASDYVSGSYRVLCVRSKVAARAGTGGGGAPNFSHGGSGALPLSNGGTGGTTAAEARANLGLEIGTDIQAFTDRVTTPGNDLNLVTSAVGSKIVIAARDNTFSFSDGTGQGFINPTKLKQSGDAQFASTALVGWTSGPAVGADIDASIRRVGTAVVGVDSILELPQVASGGTVSANTARVYSKDVGGTAEMFVKDETGNETQVSPHEPGTDRWVFYSCNDRTGRCIKVDMEKLVNAVERLSGERLKQEWRQ